MSNTIMKNKVIISELKRLTRSNKDRIKNLKYKLKILGGHVSPHDYYGCAYLKYLNSLSEFDKMYIENHNIYSEMYALKIKVDAIGVVILMIRGDKWSFK